MSSTQASYIVSLILYASIILAACGGDGVDDPSDSGEPGSTDSQDTGNTAGGDGTTNNTGGTGDTTGGGAGGGASYSTADLNGCLQPQNSGILEYYCFDGMGSWYYESWNPISGCTGVQDGGNYQVQGTTLTICDGSGCTPYQVQESGEDLLIDNAPYSFVNSC